MDIIAWVSWEESTSGFSNVTKTRALLSTGGGGEGANKNNKKTVIIT